LFDRQKDPDQRYNVAGREAYRDVIKELELGLNRQIREVGISTSELPGARKK
jgi:hypothetical protein